MKRKQITFTKRVHERATARSLFAASFLLFLIFSSGCGNKFFDRGQVGRFRPTPAVNVILDSLGVAEETPLAWEEAEEPKPIDTIAIQSDYTFMAGDYVRISIFELLAEGVHYVNDFIVTETGKISIPEVGVIEAAGLTETQLEEEIRQIVSPSLLKEPSVVVILIQSQQRTFSILGDGIAAPSRYVIPRYGFRLNDALAMAGGPRQFNVSYIYVARNEKTGSSQRGMNVPLIEPMRGGQGGMNGSEQDMLEIIAPRVQRNRSGSQVVVSSAELGTGMNLRKTMMPGDVGSIGGGDQGWPNSLGNSANGNSQGNYERTSSGSEVSVDDILKKLSQQPSRQTNTPSPNATNYSRPNTMLPSRSGNSADEVSADDILRTLSQKPVQSDSGRGVDVRETLRPNGRTVTPSRANGIGADDLLKSLSEQPGGDTGMTERADVDEVLKSFDEPSDQMGPGGARDVDEMLKSLTQPQTGPGMGEQIAIDDVELVRPTRDQAGAVAPEAQAGRIEWIFKDGKWVPLQVGQPSQAEPVIKIEPQELVVGPADGGLIDSEWSSGAGSRLIRIPADKLMAGDPRYNIVIKPGDTIHVPVDIIGEFCIMGNVNGQGYVNITGRPMTLKMAIAAAGGLGPLAVPKKVEVVRRIGKKKEEIVMVDLDKIASGEQPDFFIKPNDLINVGTDATARWRAVLRNAFRATYGFGFVYDRNFADRDYGGSPLPF